MAEGTYGGQCVETHSAAIYDRGGMRRISPIVDLSQVKWERTRDGISEAQIVVRGRACDEQRDVLRAIESHRHELVIHRGRERVWEGPIHRISWGTNQVTIVAHDIFEYLMFTPLTKTWSNAYPNPGKVTSRVREIVEYEMTTQRTQLENGVPVTIPAWERMSPPANVIDHMVVHHFINEAETTAVTYPFTMTVGEHIQYLARYSGIDFTVVGRALHVWDVSRALGRTAQLTEENFQGGVTVTQYGADHAQAAYVSGQPPEDSKVPIYGQAVRQDGLDYYGPWTKVFTPYNEEGTVAPTQGELNSQAIRNLSGRTPAPIEVRIPDNSTVLLSDALGIESLVPGVQIPLRASLAARDVTQMQKIDHVTVTETARGETIQLTLVPTTKEDADDELPEPERHVGDAFPGNADYRLTASAAAKGTSYIVKMVVEYTGSDGQSRTGADWSARLHRTALEYKDFAGEWDYKFAYYSQKTVATVQVDDAATGIHDFSVTVDMGAGIGSLTLNGSVEVG